MDIALAGSAMGGLMAAPFGRLLVGLLALAAIVLVGRLVLSVAWRLLLVAIVVVSALYTVGVLL